MGDKRRFSQGSSVLGLVIDDDDFDLDDNVSGDGGRKSVSSTTSRSSRRASFGSALSSARNSKNSAQEQSRIADMYKTVIKLSSENKINAKNSWNLDLIDHMGQLIKEDSKKEVNFQKASCTLDASIKIYSHRVDDTWSSSFRILENLSRNGAGDNVDEDDEDDRNENGAVKPRKAAKVGSKATSARLGLTNTIEKNPKNLNAVKVDGENVTDPMFQKMSKAFDEGGAKGMLMNNLKVTPHSCSLIFSENEDTVDDTSASDTSSGDGLSVSSLSDLINRLNITPVSLGTSQICPVLDDYRNIVGLDCPTSNSCLASMVSVPVVSDLPAPTSSSSHEMDGSLDSYAGDCVGCDDGDDHEDAFASEMGVDINCEDIPLSDENNGKWSQLFGDNATPVALSAGGVVYDNVASNGGSAAEKLQWDTLGVSNANDYSFFNMDSLLASGSNKWAGSRHWKFAANKRKEAGGGGGVAASKAAKAPKDRILIDFADEKLPAMSFFAPPAVPKRVAKGSSGTPNTMYTEAIINKQQLDSVSYLLPEDSKIQLHDLCRLFLRPNMIAPPPNMLSMFQPKSDDTSSSNKFLTVTVGSTSNDMIWGVLSKPTDSLAIDDDDCGPSHEDGNYMTEGGDIMYYNNAIEDDGGDDDYGEGHDNDDALISDLTSSLASGLKINSNSLVQAKRTVGKINVGYATAAKLVNVKKLKTDIWSCIQAGIADSPEKESTSSVEPKESEPTRTKCAQLSFQDVVKNVSTSTETKQNDASLSFYFISLLHLANEKSLSITGNSKMNDLEIGKGERIVGAM